MAKSKKVWGIRCQTCKVELLNVGSKVSQYPNVIKKVLAEKRRHERYNRGHRVVEVEE